MTDDRLSILKGALDVLVLEALSWGPMHGFDTRFEQEQRMTSYLDDLRHDVLFALRQMRRQPKFWSVIVLTLVVGIAASTSIFALVDGVLLKPLPYPEPDRLAHVMSGTWKGVYVHLRDRATTVDLAAYSGGPEVTLGTG